MAANPSGTSFPAFAMEASTANACTVVVCRGRLTADAADRFRGELRRLMDRSSSLVLDCKQLTFIDSAGVGALVATYTSAKKAGCDFRLINLTQRVLDLFHVTNLDKIFQGRAL